MKPAKILIVDNDAAVLSQIKTQISQVGLETICASSGREAIESFNRHYPHAVILRDSMPDISGWETAELIRAISDIPIIFISEHADRLSRNRALRIGDDILSLPWRWDYLLARLTALLKRSSAEALLLPDLYDDGYLRVDIHGQMVTREGSRVDMTQTEFKLLSCFVRHPNRALTYGEILQSVWGHGYLKAKSDVSLYVRYLRQKIEADVTQPAYLHTIRGIGYLFVAQSQPVETSLPGQ